MFGMKLRGIKIQNFKSIEDAIVENMGDIDIFSGRNNSGKTAIFEALTNVRGCSIYPEIQYRNLEPKFFSGKKFKERIMSITLAFEPYNTERSSGIKQYYPEASPDRHDELMKSKFLQRVEYSFRSFKGTSTFGLFQIKVTGTDGKLGVIAHRGEGNQFTATDIHYILTQNQPLTSQVLEHTQITTGSLRIIERNHLVFPFKLFQDLMNRVYGFSPFRTSARRLPAQETAKLSPNGQNLVQRLFTMKSNEDENWRLLQQFVKTALPALGSLQARQIGNETGTHFRDKKWNIEIDLHDMGSGIEQLLMIACALISESQGSLILIETPEHHLHPGAQRTLLQFIRENLKDNQILITTHSPVLLSQRDLTMHVVTMTNEGTKVQKVEELEDLSEALSELGSRNSDLLFADFVLFIEGTSDEKIIKAWAKTLGIDFDSKNIFCISIGGSRNFDYYANSDVLQRISLKSPIPHLFIIDRDEKSNDTVQKIQDLVKNLHILKRREIENYLLFPKHILETMCTKAEGNQEILKNLDNIQPKDIAQLISLKIDQLKNVVLLKRVREEIGGGTFLPDTELKNLVEVTKDLDSLVDGTYEAITKTLSEKCSKQRIRNIVEQQASIVNKIWEEGKKEEKGKIIPGEEILEGVFEDFGLRYDKIKDGERIAQQMKAEEIEPEIKSIIEKLQ